MKARLAFAVLCLAASASAAPAPPPGPIRVVTLSTVLTEIAGRVGGDQARVAGLVRAGVDPHTFNPSPADIRAVVDADLVLASGLSLEAYLDRLVASSGSQGRVISVGDALPAVISTQGGERDPHWWHSIDDMIAAAELIRAEFCRIRPAACGYFSANAGAYRERLLGLKAWVGLEIGRLPPARRQLVTSHDAFGYFARDYGFTIHSISGISSDSQADAGHLALLIDLIKREGIPAIFAEDSVNPRLVENLLRETGVRMGGTLYADGLGPPGSGAETYESMYRHNVRAIVEALSAR
jgi:zinc/manganese transport system substrate-binding protein